MKTARTRKRKPRKIVYGPAWGRWIKTISVPVRYVSTPTERPSIDMPSTARWSRAEAN
jgi:hypothetical protein